MTSVSLRDLSRFRNELEENISELTNSLTEKEFVKAKLSDSVETVQKRLEEQQNTLYENTLKLLDCERLLHKVRALIGQENAESNVNSLLALKASKERVLRHYEMIKTFYRRVNHSYARFYVSFDDFVEDKNRIEENLSSENSEVSRLAANEANMEVNFSIISSDIAQGADEKIKELKKEIKDIEEKLLNENFTYKVFLSAETANELRDWGVL